MEPVRAKVLLVDDERPFASAVAEYLSDHGYEVRTAFGGAEDLARAERLHVDGFLRKPCGLDRLAREIDEAVRRRRRKDRHGARPEILCVS